MATTIHKNLTASEVHAPGYIQDGDPGAVGAGKLWVLESPPFTVKKRNAANSGWDTISAGAGAGTVTSVSGTAPISVANPTTTPAITHGTSGVSAGTSSGITVDTKGHVTARTALTAADLPTGVVQTIFKQTADVTVVNTVTETSLLAANTGTKTLAANALAVGSSVRVKAWGHGELGGGGGLTVRLKLGAVTLQTLVPALVGAVPTWWAAEWIITCRTTGESGTVMCQGTLQFGAVITSEDKVYGGSTPNTTTSTIDTTGTNAVDVTWEWGAADPANTVTATNALIQYAS